MPYFRPLGHVADPWGWPTSTKQFLQSSCAEEILTGTNRVKIDAVTTDATTAVGLPRQLGAAAGGHHRPPRAYPGYPGQPQSVW